MLFEIIGDVRDVETIASGRGIRVYRRLVRQFGRGKWRKMKGFATIRLPDGRVVDAELHWYEAHGVGKRAPKIKRLLKP